MIGISREAILNWIAGAGLSPDQMRELLREEEPESVWERFQKTGVLIPEKKLAVRTEKALRAGADGKVIAANRERIERLGIRAVTCSDSQYPARLRDLPDAPAVLFYQGNPEVLKNSTVSIVGSRSAGYKGLEATRKIAENLSRAGITVISGLAYGIDAAAHQGCLKGGSPTVAVLGCGLDQEYPAENAPLRRRMIEAGGLVISEHPLGDKPLGWHFPWRNRIVSGLGDCLVLMEARIRSGSMTTVQHALNQGKDVFVYPGEADSPRCEGNHQLLREGAIYFTTAEDLMEDMGWLDKLPDVGHNNESSAQSGVQLSAAERLVMNQLDKGELGFEQLCDRTNLPAAMLSATISMLQIRGLIRLLPGKRYESVTEKQ